MNLCVQETLRAAPTSPTAPSSSSLLPTAQQNLNLPANGSSDGVPVPPPQNATVDPTTSSDTVVAPPPAGERQQRRHMTCRWEGGLCSANRKNRVISFCEPSKYLETRNDQLQSEQTPPSHRFMELTEHAAINPSLSTFNFWEFQENKIVISCAFPEGQRTHRAAHWSCSPPAVRELVVSAGQSVEVTLPRNEVELNAYVVPTPQPGKVSPGGGALWRGAELSSTMLHVWFSSGSSYAFDWRLKTHPRNYTGEMEGQKGQTLKLSKVPRFWF